MRRKLLTTPPTVPAMKISVVHGINPYLARNPAEVIAVITSPMAMAMSVAGFSS